MRTWKGDVFRDGFLNQKLAWRSKKYTNKNRGDL